MIDEIVYTRGESFWTIPDIKYRDQTETDELLHGLLPAMTQKEAGKRTRNAKPDEFVQVDSQHFYGLCKRLEELKEQPTAIKARDFIKNSMRNNYLMTLTRIDYTPKGEDTVVHNVGAKKPQQQKVNVVGPDRFIEKDDAACLEVILGTKDIDEINRVFDFINGTPLFLYRVNSKPQEVDSRVVWFGASSDRVYLSCYWSPQCSNSAFGVRKVAPLGAAKK